METKVKVSSRLADVSKTITMRRKKDAQFAEEKKALIDKACKWLKKELNKIAMDDIDDNFCKNTFNVILKDQVSLWVNDFRKAMEDEK